MIVALVALLLQPAPPASPPDPSSSPELMAAATAWNNCLGASQDRLQDRPEAPQEVVQMILDSCNDRQLALRNAMRDWMATFAPAEVAEREADEGIVESRAAYETGISRMLLERRASQANRAVNQGT